MNKTIDRASSTDIFDYEDPVITNFESIYIRTVYATEEEVSADAEIYEYEIKDDDFATVGVFSGLGDYELRLSPQHYTGDETGDYGIKVYDDGTISFCENTGGLCGGIKEVRDLSEPLNAFAIEIMMNIIVFEDSVDEVVMYCPDCEEAYYNGEESCLNVEQN